MSLITISQSTGSGGYKIARLVAGGLDIEFYDDLRLQEEAARLGIRKEDIKSMNEKAPGFFDQILSKKPEMYLEFMEAVIYEIARRGSGVIIGHGSPLLLRNFDCAMHVFIHASESTRVDNYINQHNLSRETAEKLIRKNDNEKSGFFRFAFHLNWNDPSLYDLIINTGKMGPEMAAKLIIKAARSDEMNECGLGALEAMERLSLEKKIKAALLKNNINPTLMHIEVPETGVAVVRGISIARQMKERIISVVRSVPEITEVKSEISVIDQGYS